MELQAGSVGYASQVRAIVVYGDIRGFSTWEDKVTNPDVEFKPLMNEFAALIDWLEEESGAFTKNLGDGYMQVVELPQGHACGTAIRTLKLNWEFYVRVMREFHRHLKRPEGFRVRWRTGYIWKKGGPKLDYVGRWCNRCHDLLHVAPEVPFVGDTEMVALMTPAQLRRAGFRAQRLDGHPGLYRFDAMKKR